MSERRVNLDKALQIFRRIRARTYASTSTNRENRNMAWRCSGPTNRDLIENLFRVALLFTLICLTASSLEGVKSCVAWRRSGTTHKELIENLFRARIMQSVRAKNAMLSVDRADFSPRDPYMDSPQGIGWNATISAPHMHAAALQYLDEHLFEGARALDIGSGSGYLTVCMAKMVGPTGKVVGIDHIQQLVDLSINNVNKHNGEMLGSGNIVLKAGDGRLGYPEFQPYNAIHVGAAAEKVPQELINQLADGGRMVIPVGKEHGGQVFLQIDKKDGEVTQKVIEHVIYVPLTTKEHQLGYPDPLRA